MDTLIVVLQVVLAAVLSVAAVGKFMDRAGSRQAVIDFGVPERYASALGGALPIVEVLLAIGLLIEPTARWAALGTAILFLVFIAAISWNLRQGRQPDCHCFGQIHSEPAGPSTLIRNALLTLASLVIVWSGGRSIPEWVRDLSDAGTLGLLIGIAIVVLGAGQIWLMRQLLQQNGRILDRLAALAGDAPDIPNDSLERQRSGPELPLVAPAFDVPALEGGRLRLDELLENGKPVFLLFVDPNCDPCRQLVPDMAEWNRRFAGDITVAWLSWGAEDDNRDKFAAHGMSRVGLQEDRDVYLEYQVNGTPSGVLVHPDGVIREEYATGRNRIRELLAWAVSQGAGTPDGARPAPRATHADPADPATLLRVAEGPEVGTHGTRVPFPDLDGGFVSLDDYAGKETVLLFIGASCEFTRRMLPELREWEREAGAFVERVLAVSMGTVEENRELGLKSRIVIDDGFTMATSFGATGTPAAILLDAEGKVASPLAVGNDAVLDLLWEQIETGEDGEPIVVVSEAGSAE